MKHIVLVVLMTALLSGCALYQSESVRHVRRIPVEETPVTQTVQPDRPWYTPIAEGLGGLIAVEPLVGMFQVVGTTLVDITGNITGAVIRVKKGSIYEEITYKRSAWFVTNPQTLQFINDQGSLMYLRFPQMKEVESEDASIDNSTFGVWAFCRMLRCLFDRGE